MTYNLVDACPCPKHFFAVYFHYSVDLKFKSRIPVRKIFLFVSLYTHRKLSFSLCLSFFFQLYFTLEKFAFFLFLLSSIRLFDIAMGTDPPPLLSHSNWLPGSHHCHFLITHNPPWASPLQRLLDHQI